MSIDAEPNGHLQPIRDARGRFPKGVSGNPSGRPPPDFDLVRRCRGLTPTMVSVWEEVARNPEAKDADRIAAAALVVWSGFGKPAASLTLDLGGSSELLERRRQVAEALQVYQGLKITFQDEPEQLEAEDEDEGSDDGDDRETAEDAGSSL